MKKWYESKAIWGGVVSILSVILGAAGYQLSAEDTEALVVLLMGVGGMVGGALAIWGRIKASRTIS